MLWIVRVRVRVREVEWNTMRRESEDLQVPCKHCQCTFASSIIAINKIFCIENDLNLTFPIQYRNRPCFCLDCQNGDECNFGHITANDTGIKVVRG